MISNMYNPFDTFGLMSSIPPFSEKISDISIFLKILKTTLSSLSIAKIILIFWILFINFMSLFLWDLNIKEEKILYFFFTYILYFVIIVSPSIFSMKFWSTDSAYHLLLVKKLATNLNYTTGNYYGNFLFHKFFALLSILFHIEIYQMHNIFLFLPQFIMSLTFFIGLYFLMFSHNSIFDFSINKKKEFFFLLILFHPFLIFNFSFMAPFCFVLSFSPLIFYLSINYKKSLNILLLSLIILICICSHIFGFFYIIISLIIMISSQIFHCKNKNNLILAWKINVIFICLSLLLLFFMNNLILLVESIFSNIFADSRTLSRFIQSFGTSGVLKEYYFKFESVFSTFKLFEFIIRLGPIFFIIVNNQFYYYKNYKNKNKLNRKSDIFRIFTDFFFPFIILSLFYGYVSSFDRIIIMVIIIYYILFLENINVKIFIRKIDVIISRIFSKFQQKWNEIFKKRYDEKKIKNIRYTQYFAICLLLMLFTNMLYIQNRPYSDAQYESINWIASHTPSDSTIITNHKFNYLVEALSSRNSTYYCRDLFNNETDENQRIEDYLNLYVSNGTLFLLLDINPYYNFLLETRNHTRIGLNVIIPIIENSTYFQLLYNQSEILIYYLNYSFF
ncbi:hypothetical protein NEF87_004303 [Candidatus Lokiarchaeum ossiferum]|uniref:DUF2079 domain-containing protein n=1 Tax=Candidatus Lokiarchaeum ossiferum TaxID=2951803 RepID=A0ABY6HXB6_9ARCH|nr:hypothetical protein NEF87_004303 [Candidatus Lokiarchaeum sp. B-35]